jgi:hypothetical protein
MFIDLIPTPIPLSCIALKLSNPCSSRTASRAIPSTAAGDGRSLRRSKKIAVCQPEGMWECSTSMTRTLARRTRWRHSFWYVLRLWDNWRSYRGWFVSEQALMDVRYRARPSSTCTSSSRRTPCYHWKVRLCPLETTICPDTQRFFSEVVFNTEVPSAHSSCRWTLAKICSFFRRIPYHGSSHCGIHLSCLRRKDVSGEDIYHGLATMRDARLIQSK